MWLTPNVWCDSLSEADRRAGGRWLISDQLPLNNPGRSTKVLYKSWVADQGRYRQGQYEFKTRSCDQMWEYVIVLDGRLDGEVRDTESTLRLVLESREWIDIAPDLARRWELPQNYRVAPGVTMLRRLNGIIWQAWPGERFELRLFDERSSHRLFEPASDTAWDKKLVEVFDGELRLRIEGVRSHVELGAGTHVIVSRGMPESWMVKSERVLGCVLCF